MSQSIANVKIESRNNMDICFKYGEIYHMKKAEELKEIYQAFEPYPLNQPDQIHDFYVDTYNARGQNVVKRMSLALELSENPYMKILLMGHRGSGKSTELSLLKENLKDNFDIINFNIQNEVDAGNMTYIDFIFAIMSQIIKYIENNSRLHLDENDLDELYEYWYGEKILEKTTTDQTGAAVDFKAKLSFLNKIAFTGSGIFKTGSESKISIRQKIEPKAGHLILLMNQIITKINNHLSNKGLLIIIEDLDKLNLQTSEALFITYRRIWLDLHVRMILTFPIFMAYNSQYNMINEDIDMSFMLSMIKVKTPDKLPYPEGISTLKQIISKRAELSLFDEDALLFLIEKSGGAIRDLFEMIRNASFEAIMDSKEKITIEEAYRVYLPIKSRYERLIRSETEVEKLVQIYNDPQLLTTDNTMMDLLIKGLALEYNGERWCGIHPAVEDFLIDKGQIYREGNDE